MGKHGCNKDIAFGTFEAPTAKHPHGRKYGAGGWRNLATVGAHLYVRVFSRRITSEGRREREKCKDGSKRLPVSDETRRKKKYKSFVGGVQIAAGALWRPAGGAKPWENCRECGQRNVLSGIVHLCSAAIVRKPLEVSFGF